jgi:dienelactone hydrolase
MIKIFRLVLFCLIALSTTVGSSAADNTDIRELLSKHYQLEKPDGTGFFPAVMMVPGCSGFDAEFQKAFYDGVQSQLVNLGFVTLRVNYLAARNVPICWPHVPIENVAGDISIAAEYLRQQPFVKKGTINVMGWSYGGAGALQALLRTENREPVHVDAVVVYYPACERAQKWDSEITVPALVLVGANDNVAPFWQCEEIFGDISKRPNLTVRKYDNAHHSFDNSTLPAEKQYVFGTLGYNEAAAKSAWKEVINFLRK